MLSSPAPNDMLKLSACLHTPPGREAETPHGRGATARRAPPGGGTGCGCPSTMRHLGTRSSHDTVTPLMRWGVRRPPRWTGAAAHPRRPRRGTGGAPGRSPGPCARLPARGAHGDGPGGRAVAGWPLCSPLSEEGVVQAAGGGIVDPATHLPRHWDVSGSWPKPRPFTCVQSCSSVIAHHGTL